MSRMTWRRSTRRRTWSWRWPSWPSTMWSSSTPGAWNGSSTARAAWRSSGSSWSRSSRTSPSRSTACRSSGLSCRCRTRPGAALHLVLGDAGAAEVRRDGLRDRLTEDDGVVLAAVLRVYLAHVRQVEPGHGRAVVGDARAGAHGEHGLRVRAVEQPAAADPGLLERGVDTPDVRQVQRQQILQAHAQERRLLVQVVREVDHVLAPIALRLDEVRVFDNRQEGDGAVVDVEPVGAGERAAEREDQAQRVLVRDPLQPLRVRVRERRRQAAGYLVRDGADHGVEEDRPLPVKLDPRAAALRYDPLDGLAGLQRAAQVADAADEGVD